MCVCVLAVSLRNKTQISDIWRWICYELLFVLQETSYVVQHVTVSTLR